MRVRRRDFLKMALSGCALTSGVLAIAPSGISSARAARPERGAPARYVLQIFLTGGVDSVYTTDPKTRGEVEGWVSVPYAPSEIIEANGVRVGPHFAPLLPMLGELALVNGVQTHTANHITGEAQFWRLRTRVQERMPHLGAILGLGRGERPIGCLAGNWFGGRSATDTFGHLETVDPADLRRMSVALRGQARELSRGGSDSRRSETASRITQAADFLDRLPRLPKFTSENWEEGRGSPFARDLQRAVWAFENDVTVCCELTLGAGRLWDSHSFNDARQHGASMAMLPLLTRVFAELEKRSNEHGNLADRTLVVMGSDVGRYPGINSNLGKDHWPETFYMFAGAGINRGGSKAKVFGQTGRKMEALPVSMKTGRPDDGGRYLRLDDIGATVLRLAGISNPEVYGYDGRFLEFLVA